MYRAVLVEDDEPLRFLLKLLLESSGSFKIVGQAENGLVGIQVCKTEQPDVVLLDLKMPVMGGVEALPHIIREAPHACVLVVSMMPRMDFEAELLRAGATAFLDKGQAGPSLVAKILEVVRARKGTTGDSDSKVSAPQI